MTKHERIIIDLALEILRDARDRADKGRVDTVPVRLALRVLLPHCPERWPLSSFWSGAAADHDIGRAQSTGASFNGIMVQLKQSGAYTEPPRVKAEKGLSA